jgi:uncharacterized protein
MIKSRNTLTPIVLLSTLLLVNGCKEEKKLNADPTQKETIGEACSIELPEIHFTKSLHGASKNALVENGAITIVSDAKKDYFNEPDGTLNNNSAPILLSEVDNTKPFTLTSKVTPVFTTTYDAGALYIFSTDLLWQKFAFEQDERGQTRIVSVRTIETSDDNNHEVISQENVYLKITSDTKTVGFYFSIDNETWNLARLYKNDYPETIWVGISSQSPIGEGNTTKFENCSLTKKAISDFRLGI